MHRSRCSFTGGWAPHKHQVPLALLNGVSYSVCFRSLSCGVLVTCLFTAAWEFSVGCMSLFPLATLEHKGQGKAWVRQVGRP